MPAEFIRRPDWPARLQALLESRRTMAYAFGTNDCAAFVQDAIIAVTGRDPLPGIERPTSWIGAAKFLIARGWDDVEQMANDLLGPPLATAQRAGRGDVVSFADKGEHHLAVVVGASAATPGGTGLVFVPMSRWLTGWKIG